MSSYERALAFSIGGASEPERIRRSDWEQWAKAMAFAPRRVLSRLEELALAAFEESIGDRCRWVLNNVIARR